MSEFWSLELNLQSFSGRTRHLFGFGMGLLMTVGSALTVAQMVPDAPIENFRLPFFGEDGYKSWELRGVRGTYRTDSTADIEGMELVTYNGGAQLKVGNRIRSPKATISFEEPEAYGSSSIFVSGDGFFIQGQEWTWRGKDNFITVSKDVHVEFEGTLDILK